MELYYVISVTDREKGERMAELYREAGLRMSLAMLGRGTATDEHLGRYGLEQTEKSIVCAVAGPEEAAQLRRLARRRMFIDIPGNGIMLSVPLKSVAGQKSLAYLAGSERKGGRPAMDFEYELIIAVMNEGYSDLLMDAARSAGAGGGTVLHAKGTGSSRGESFLGVTLADEKDLVYIVAHKSEKTAVMRAIHERAGPGTKAGAICFSLPVSSVVGLRARDDTFS